VPGKTQFHFRRKPLGVLVAVLLHIPTSLNEPILKLV
jgi:hypothetical protein